MPLEHRAFVDLLRQSYPDDYHRAKPDQGDYDHWAWKHPDRYNDAADCRAALVHRLMDDQFWVRLSGDDQVELTRLAGLQEPLADLYNYVEYRMNQTVIWDPVTDHTISYPPGSSWKPFIEPTGNRGSAEVEGAAARVAARVAAVDMQASSRVPAAGPQAPPTVERPGGSAAGSNQTAWRPADHGKQSGSSYGRDGR
jgi:hypothetical protein